MQQQLNLASTAGPLPPPTLPPPLPPPTLPPPLPPPPTISMLAVVGFCHRLALSIWLEGFDMRNRTAALRRDVSEVKGCE